MSTPSHEFAGFFLLRTPLLPFDAWQSWSHGTDSASDPRLELRARLRRWVLEPAAAEAIYLASPQVSEHLERWRDAELPADLGDVEHSIARYFARMCGRSTPFGMFAGVSVGRSGPTTSLSLAPRNDYRRHLRLDNGYLFELTTALATRPEVRPHLVLRPNRTLHELAGGWRMTEAVLEGQLRSFHLSRVQSSEYLELVLRRAVDGATVDELADALVADDPEIERAEAEDFVHTLLDEQVLESDLAPLVTGDEPVHELLGTLARIPAVADLTASLDRAHRHAVALSEQPPGARPSEYRALKDLLANLPVPAQENRLVQVDMTKPSTATLSDDVTSEMRRGAELLFRLFAKREDPLRAFKDSFRERYELREVPLLAALDDEAGIGAELEGGPERDPAPLVEGLPFSSGEAPAPRLMNVHTVLLRVVEEAARRGNREIVLEPQWLDRIPALEARSLPETFAVTASLAAAPESGNDGAFRILIQSVLGYSGGQLLGRFCHAEPQLTAPLREFLSREEAGRPEAVHAEVVHLPEGRIGNILMRPVLRSYEIAFLGRSGASPERVLSPADLTVRLEGTRLVLRSRSLGREVIPRLTTAHNFSFRSHPLYRFLCSLQSQDGLGAASWDWGPLEAASFLPRVVSGRVVLARARWGLSKKEIDALARLRGAEALAAAASLREKRGLPRLVVLADGDNELPVDLENLLSLESCLDVLRGRSGTHLVELFPGPDELCVTGPEGHYANEVIVPFARVRSAATATQAPPTGAGVRKAVARGPEQELPHERSFLPGGEWLYVKVYAGTETLDRLLLGPVREIVHEALQSEAARQWFFLRYADPRRHLRLRLNGDAARLRELVLPRLHDALASWIAEDLVWKVQLDTYQRETERYGGPVGIEIAENLFHADSEFVLDALSLLDGDPEGAARRWQIGIGGVHRILAGLGFDHAGCREIVRGGRDRLAHELGGGKALRVALGARFRKEREVAERMIDVEISNDPALAPGVAELFSRHRAALHRGLHALRDAGLAGKLTHPLEEIAVSHTHLFVNRLMRSAQVQHELVFYDFLERVYESRLARERSRAKTAPPQREIVRTEPV